MSEPNPNYVRIVNPVWNGSGVIKRKLANFYVIEGRAEFVAGGQLRMLDHPQNRAALERAGRGYKSPNGIYSRSPGTSTTERPRHDDGRYIGPNSLLQHRGERTNGRFGANRGLQAWRQTDGARAASREKSDHERLHQKG